MQKCYILCVFRDWSEILRDASDAVMMNLLEVEEERKNLKRKPWILSFFYRINTEHYNSNKFFLFFLWPVCALKWDPYSPLTSIDLCPKLISLIDWFRRQQFPFIFNFFNKYVASNGFSFQWSVWFSGFFCWIQSLNSGLLDNVKIQFNKL